MNSGPGAARRAYRSEGADTAAEARRPSPEAGSVRVGFLSGRLGIGGSEVHLGRLAIRLRQRQFPCEILLTHREGTFLERVLEAGVPVHGLHMEGRDSLWRTARRLRQIAIARQIDIVQSYGFTCDLIACLSALPFAPYTLLTTRRGNEQNRRRRLIYGVTNLVANQVLCVSEAARDFARRTEGLPGSKAIVIPNGLELGPYLEIERTSRPIRILGTVGRLRAIKGSDLLLDAFASFGRTELRLRMGGPVFDDESLTREVWGKRLYEANRDRPGVEFPGELHDIPAFLKDLDLFVLPSRSEGMSNALIEAMAAGLPIVATAVGGNPETLGHGEAGLLVPPEAEAIAAAIKRLVENPDEARALGDRARQRARREYGIDTMVDRYEAFYRSLTRRRG